MMMITNIFFWESENWEGADLTKSESDEITFVRS